jgi:uroporphyrinogen III methyltransferase/synthase
MSTPRKRPARPVGVVSLVGTGSGDDTQLTVRARDVISAADLVVVDAESVHPGVLGLIRSGAEVVAVDEAATTALVSAAREGRRAVRLFPGDPFLWSSAAEVGAAVRKARQRLEVVPGLPPAVGVPAFAGIPVGLPRTVVEVDPRVGLDGAAYATVPGTLVLRAPATAVSAAAQALVAGGRAASTPLAVIAFGATTRQRTGIATLGEPELALESIGGLAAAGTVVAVIGDAVSQRARLSWWEDRSLFGWTVLVPRTRDQAGGVSDRLRALGADPLEVPTIAVEAPRTPAPMERAVRGLVGGRYAWVAFTSANAVKAVREKIEEVGLDARAFAGVKVAAVGEQTAEALADFGIRADLTPQGSQSSEGLLVDWPEHDCDLDLLDRVLLPRADIATETLAAGLKARGWTIDDVTAYRTVRASPPPVAVREALRSGRVDAVLFTSSSTVRNLVALVGQPHPATIIVAIGPATAAAARELGLRVDVLSEVASTDGLVDALVAFAKERAAESTEPIGPPSRTAVGKKPAAVKAAPKATRKK